MKIVNSSLILQTLLLLYLEAIEWLDLFPWNDVRSGNDQEALDVALGLLMIGALIATFRRIRLGMGVAVALYGTWLGLQVITFWIPYFRGASAQWQRIHASNFAQTVQWLPTWGTHLPPDASHFLLQILLLVTLIATVAATIYVWQQPR